MSVRRRSARKPRSTCAAVRDLELEGLDEAAAASVAVPRELGDAAAVAFAAVSERGADTHQEKAYEPCSDRDCERAAW